MNTVSINIHFPVLMCKIFHYITVHYITLHTQVILYTHITNVKKHTIFLNGEINDNQND